MVSRPKVLGAPGCHCLTTPDAFTALVLDMSATNFTMNTGSGEDRTLPMCKGFDTFNPIGRFIDRAELPNPRDVLLSLEVCWSLVLFLSLVLFRCWATFLMPSPTAGDEHFPITITPSISPLLRPTLTANVELIIMLLRLMEQLYRATQHPTLFTRSSRRSRLPPV